ncbi:MAG: iron-sulfur cluster-binding domain-containing protein [Vicinamibacterales bacterium]
MPSLFGLAAGFIAHLTWFVACEKLLLVPAPAPVAAPPRKATAAPAPAPTRTARVAQPARVQPRGFMQTAVMAIFDETPDIRTFRLARPDGFQFSAGQFLTVRLKADGREHVRCYSISSAPGAQAYLEISVKRIGLVSSALHATLRPGAMLAVREPAGAFVYPSDDQRPLVLLAGGVGITPLMSMLRHAVDAEPNRPVTLFYSVRRTADIAFYDELSVVMRRHEHVRVFIAVSDETPSPGHFPGFISESLVTTMVPDIAHAVCLICGPPPMMDAMTKMLASVGVPSPQVRFEVFQAAVAASTRALAPSGPVPAGPVPAGPDLGVAKHDVVFERSGQRTQVDGEQTLLDAAETCGADIPSLCRAGVCGTCRTKVISGDTDCQSSMLDADDRAAGYVLACVTQVTSHCAVDA